MLSLLVGLLACAVKVQKACEKKVEAKAMGRDATRRVAQIPHACPGVVFLLVGLLVCVDAVAAAAVLACC